ncbi:hypothetical protein UPYG_G00032460 [Umbra pygmaea]|uniref:Uncharacterized protein n=1 Tax=Umbra pygmaea TaxID=75934 RepID=A0ABD0XQZ3_UMBPY
MVPQVVIFVHDREEFHSDCDYGYESEFEDDTEEFIQPRCVRSPSAGHKGLLTRNHAVLDQAVAMARQARVPVVQARPANAPMDQVSEARAPMDQASQARDPMDQASQSKTSLDQVCQAVAALSLDVMMHHLHKNLQSPSTKIIQSPNCPQRSTVVVVTRGTYKSVMESSSQARSHLYRAGPSHSASKRTHSERVRLEDRNDLVNKTSFTRAVESDTSGHPANQQLVVTPSKRKKPSEDSGCFLTCRATPTCKRPRTDHVIMQLPLKKRKYTQNRVLATSEPFVFQKRTWERCCDSVSDGTLLKRQKFH